MKFTFHLKIKTIYSFLQVLVPFINLLDKVVLFIKTFSFSIDWLKTCVRRNLQYIRPWIPHNLFRFPIEFLQVLSLEKHFTPWHLFIFKFVFFQDVFYTELHMCKRFIYLKWNIRHVSLSVCHEISLTYPKWHNFSPSKMCHLGYVYYISKKNTICLSELF